MEHGATAFLPSFGKLPKLIALTIRGVDVCLTRLVITNIQQARCLNTLELSLHGTSYDDGVMAFELSSLERLSLPGDVTNIQQARCLNTLELSLHGTSYDDGVMALELSTVLNTFLWRCLATVHTLHSSNHYSSTIRRRYRVPPTCFPKRNRCGYGIVIHIVPTPWILETDLCGGQIRFEE
jgi:hypothetical protein